MNMSLIGPNGGSKYDEAGMMTGLNDEVVITGGNWIGGMKIA